MDNMNDNLLRMALLVTLLAVVGFVLSRKKK